MNNNLDFTKKGLFLTEDVNWKSKESVSSELLSDKDKITEIVSENLENLNNILLIKNYPFCNTYNGTLTFGIQINLNSIIYCTSIKALNELQSDKSRYSQYFAQYYYSGPYNFSYKVISIFHFDNSEIKELFEKFSEATNYTPLVFLQLGNNFNKKLEDLKNPENTIVLILAGNDLYELKSASKLFRKEDISYREYFYQQNEECPYFNKILSLEETEILNDDAHRVIFEKINIQGDINNEKK
jgi:hypothetical protein